MEKKKFLHFWNYTAVNKLWQIFFFFPLMVEQSIPLSRSHVMHELCALMSLMFANGYHHVKATRTSDCR